MSTTKHWQTMLIPYQQAVDELLLKINHLKEQNSQLGENSPIENVTGRVKSLSSILEKMNKYDCDVEDIEKKIKDIAGIRIICQFVDDIYEVLNMFYDRNGKDLKVVQLKNYLGGHDKSKFNSGEGHPKASGYESFHLILLYPVFTSLGYKEVYVEVQIRTLAMNFWAVIEHSLNYKYKGQLPPAIKKRLIDTAKAVNHLDNEMSVIRKEVLSAQKIFKMKSSTVNEIQKNITYLHRLKNDALAREYEEEFESISQQEDLIQLMLLKQEVESEVDQLKGNPF